MTLKNPLPLQNLIFERNHRWSVSFPLDSWRIFSRFHSWKRYLDAIGRLVDINILQIVIIFTTSAFASIVAPSDESLFPNILLRCSWRCSRGFGTTFGVGAIAVIRRRQFLIFVKHSTLRCQVSFSLLRRLLMLWLLLFHPRVTTGSDRCCPFLIINIFFRQLCVVLPLTSKWPHVVILYCWVGPLSWLCYVLNDMVTSLHKTIICRLWYGCVCTGDLYQSRSDKP